MLEAFMNELCRNAQYAVDAFCPLALKLDERYWLMLKPIYFLSYALHCNMQRVLTLILEVESPVLLP